jgi:hypothetical protein
LLLWWNLKRLVEIHKRFLQLKKLRCVVHIFVIELVPPKFPDRDSIRNDLPPFHPPPHHHQLFERYGDVFPFSTYGSIGLISGFFVDFPHRDGAVPLSEIGKLIF